MVAIFNTVHQKQSPATVSPPHQGNPQCFNFNPPPEAHVQDGESRVFFNNLHSAKLAQKSNLTYYEEAEDSDKVDNLGEKKKEELGEIECEEMPENSLIAEKHASPEDIISEETDASDA